MKFDVALLEKPLDEGLVKKDILLLYGFLEDSNYNGTTEILPIEVAGNQGQSIAIGFITMEAAEQLEYEFEKTGLSGFIAEFVDDEGKKKMMASSSYRQNNKEFFRYEFEGLNIWCN